MKEVKDGLGRGNEHSIIGIGRGIRSGGRESITSNLTPKSNPLDELNRKG